MCLQNLTMVLSMGPLSEEMVRRPRYWLRLFSVISSTIQCEEIPPIILQVSSSTPTVDVTDLWNDHHALPCLDAARMKCTPMIIL